MSRKIVLGIETSCDDTAAAVIERNGNFLSVKTSILASQIKIHAPYGGVVPRIAAREHLAALPNTIETALQKASIKPGSVDLIAVTSGPGLISSLLVGTTFANTLAWRWHKKIVGINHIAGHIVSAWLKPIGEALDLSILSKSLPAIALIVSGGHTELIYLPKLGQYIGLGKTIDDAAGEAFDKIARIIGLDYPGGPAISRAALKATGKINCNLPRPMIHSKDLRFSFSGLKTAALYAVRGLLDESYNLADIAPDIAHEAQLAIIETLVVKTGLALDRYRPKTLILGGGVAANTLLREQLQILAAKNNTAINVPELSYTTDNAAMIAAAGALIDQGGENLPYVNADANWEIT